MITGPVTRVGSDLGPYRIEGLIGRGGMGVVYLAEDRELGRRVALKLLPDELAADRDFRARFERESRLAASLDHPNIIPIFEAGEADGVVYLAMRYVEGQDLATKLASDPPSPDQALHVLTQVARALDVAHGRGLVHRDVKPANVLLDPTAGDSEGDHAYLTDFGLTKLVGSASGATKAGTFLGTLAYMAPEQIDGREIDGRADEYSLAAMTFECLAGRVPFQRDQEIAVAMAHLKDPVPSARALRPDLATGVDVVLARGMSKDPNDRYPTCGAFVAALGAAMAGESVAAPVPQVDRARGVRSGVVVSVAAAGLLGLVAVAVGGLIIGSPPGTPPPTAGASDVTDDLGVGNDVPPTLRPAPSPAPEPFPDLAEATLLASFPLDLTSRCARGSTSAWPETAGSKHAIPIASIHCRMDAEGVSEMSIRQFAPPSPSGFSADEVIAAEQRGACADGLPAAGHWPSEDKSAGSFAWAGCGGQSPGSAVHTPTIQWTFANTSVAAEAIGKDWKTLRDWWVRNRSLINGLPGLRASLNAAERALQAKLPVSVSATCRPGTYEPLTRGKNEKPVTPSASLACPLNASSTKFPEWSSRILLIVREFARADGPVRSILDEDARAHGAVPGDCAITDGVKGRWFVGDREAGALACYQDPRAIIQWTFDDRSILNEIARFDPPPPDVFGAPMFWWWDSVGRFWGAPRPKEERNIDEPQRLIIP